VSPPRDLVSIEGGEAPGSQGARRENTKSI
jgi:hypothetical protein